MLGAEAKRDHRASRSGPATFRTCGHVKHPDEVCPEPVQPTVNASEALQPAHPRCRLPDGPNNRLIPAAIDLKLCEESEMSVVIGRLDQDIRHGFAPPSVILRSQWSCHAVLCVQDDQ